MHGVNQHEKALMALNSALLGLSPLDRAYCGIDLALTYLKMVKLEKASSQINATRNIFKELNKSDGLAICDLIELHILQRKGLHHEYLRDVERISDQLLAYELKNWYVFAQTQTAFSLRGLGRFEDAERIAIEALPMAKKLELTYRQALLRYTMAICHSISNRPHKMLLELEKAEKLCLKSGAQVLMADILMNRAFFFESRGNLSLSIAYSKQAALLYQYLGLGKNEAWAFSEIGAKLNLMGEIQQAGTAFQKAHELMNKQNDRQLLNEINFRMALLHVSIGQIPQARNLFEEIIKNSNKDNAPSHYISIACAYATTMCASDEFDALYKRAQEALGMSPPSIYSTVAQRVLAHQLVEHRRWEEARHLLTAAIVSSSEWPQQNAISLLELVECNLSEIQNTSFGQNLPSLIKRSRSQLRQIKKNARLLPEINARALTIMADIAQLMNKPSLALSYLDEAIQTLRVIRLSGSDPALVSSLAGRFDDVYWRGARLAHELDNTNALVSFVEHRRAQWLARALNARTSNPAPLPELDALRRDLHRLRSSPSSRIHPGLSSELQAGFDEVAQRYAQMDLDLMFAPSAEDSAISPLRRHVPVAGLEELRSVFNTQFGKDWVAVVLEPISSRSTEWILLRITPHGQEHLSLSANALIHKMLQTLAEGNSRFRRRFFGAKGEGSREFQILSEWLSVSSWIELDSENPMTNPKGTTLIIAEAGWLSRLPIGSLPMKDGRALGECAVVRFAPSLNTMAMLSYANKYKNSTHPQNSVKRALIVAPHGFNGRYPDLPFSLEEAALVRQNWPDSEVLLDENASLAGMRKMAQHQKLEHFDVIWFATHAQSEPHHHRLSGLALRDGDITLQEILSWRLNARLVCLSACDSSFATTHGGEERLGIETALIASGARNVLSSRWPVSDSATAIFMSAFLRHYSREQNAALSLMFTILELKEKISRADLAAWRVTGAK